MTDNRETVKVVAYEKRIGESIIFSDRYEHDKLLQIKDWVEQLIAFIPKDLIQSARLEIYSEEGYEQGDHSEFVRVYYERPETDEEMADRLYKTNEYEQIARERDLAKLRELQKKYPDEKPKETIREAIQKHVRAVNG